MKKSISFFVLLALSTWGYSQTPLANFFTENGEMFYIILDGRQINDTPANRVSNVPLEHDWAKVKIIFENKEIPELSKTIQGVDVDGIPSHVTWMIKQKKNGKWVMNASAWSALEPEQPEVQTVVVNENYVAPPPQPSEISQTTVTTTTTTVQNPNQVSVSGNVNGVGVNINMNIPDVDVTYTETHTQHTVTTTTTSTYQEDVAPPPPPAPNPLPGYSGPIGCDFPMSPGAFNTARQSIMEKTFEDTKLTMAKQVTNVNCLLANQVKEIMMTFTYEDTKLEFAKFAYTHTYDLGNYYMVNDAFTYESSIDELNEYLGL